MQLRCHQLVLCLNTKQTTHIDAINILIFNELSILEIWLSNNEYKTKKCRSLPVAWSNKLPILWLREFNNQGSYSLMKALGQGQLPCKLLANLRNAIYYLATVSYSLPTRLICFQKINQVVLTWLTTAVHWRLIATNLLVSQIKHTQLGLRNPSHFLLLLTPPRHSLSLQYPNWCYVREARFGDLADWACDIPLWSVDQLRRTAWSCCRDIRPHSFVEAHGGSPV
jgi:hypothetical protein